jgi:aspartate aminotransferase
VIVNGVSKAYAMTGWRIGYAAGPKLLIDAMKKIQSQSTSNPCSIAQRAAVEALNGDQSSIPMMVKAYKERHDFVYESLNQMPGIRCPAADGTFYAFPDVSEAIKNLGLNNDLEFAEKLLLEANVAVVPGVEFGAPGHMRISYATSLEQLKTAMQRIKEIL